MTIAFVEQVLFGYWEFMKNLVVGLGITWSDKCAEGKDCIEGIILVDG